MKKSVIKSAVFVVTFFLSMVIIGRLMNKGHDNLTVEMEPASLPLVTMELNGVDYNQLHGYVHPMDVAFQRDTVTVLGEGRTVGFSVQRHGRNVTGISIEVRSIDGSRLIENTALTDYATERDRISGTLALKDLIEPDTEYSLAMVLELDGSEKVYYYTRAIWSDGLHAEEKLAYVVDFHQRLYNREAARELTKYLETNAKLEDNSSFHKVNIHSSFRQITWGELNVSEVGSPVFLMTEIAGQTASFLVDYVVTTTDGKSVTYYTVEEYFRVRYSPQRMYLLDYERTMTQLPNTEHMCANDKILLGITGTDVHMMESEDGNIVVFEAAGRLFSYDLNTNSLAVIFGFYDKENADGRTIYNRHSLKILDVDEGGNVQFAVYGYMNRGRHEGEVGLQVLDYNSSLNTTEELVYIGTDKGGSVLGAELEELLYMNRDRQLYLRMDNGIYEIDLEKRNYSRLIAVNRDEGIRVSQDNKILVWPEGEDVYFSSELHIRNLSNHVSRVVSAAEGEAVMPLGFMDEDVIYGVARKEDIVRERSGRTFFPMYKVCICNASGELLKEYQQPDVYVTNCTVEENQIVLERVKRKENGDYVEESKDHIMNNNETASKKNSVVPADIDVYERYVQIRTHKEIDTKSIKTLTPKEVVYEGGREFSLPEKKETDRYYVYGAYGIEDIFYAPSRAVNLAHETSGVVTDESGKVVWLKGSRAAKNQIMAIKETPVTEGKDSLAVCLDVMFQFEGIVRNSEYLLAQGRTVLEIMEQNLDGVRVLDMTGCSLDAMLYYVNLDLPVLALLENGEAVLVTGYNDRQIVILDPVSGKLCKKGISESEKWFQENGNCFITYMR